MASHLTAPRQQEFPRRQRGDLLIEVLIAMFVATLFAAAILQMYVQTFSIGNNAQDQIMAASLGQACVDALRALPYETVLEEAQTSQTHYAVVNGSPGTDTLFVRPLLQDTSVLTYTAGADSVTQAGLTNRFEVVNNQVVINITPQSSNTILVDVLIDYLDSTGPHSYHTYTILVKNGLNS
jgi:Tfp pilus assembly protein PilV